jgi:hypothetical protein
MRSARSVLALRYTPVSVMGGVRKAVGGFLRYVQYRDQHLEPERDGGLDDYVRYVVHRDRTSPGSRVFGRDDSPIGVDRKQLVDYITRSTKGLAPKWVQGRDGKQKDRQRAAYTFVLSPEDWRGLDLRHLARAAMNQLEADTGAGDIGPWIAAEHRNTAHHHVHIVLAARRELEPGRFQTVVITRARLQRMKEAIGREIDRQRGPALERDETPRGGRASRTAAKTRKSGHDIYRWRKVHRPLANLRARKTVHRGQLAGATLWRLQGVALRYRYQMERDLDEQLAGQKREGWVR